MSQVGRGLVLTALVAVGCESFSKPTDADLEEVRRLAPVPGPYLRARARIDVASAWLSGQFEGVLVVRSASPPVVRLQCLPDLGGKALDLVARPDRVVGWLPQLGEGTDAALPAQDPLAVTAVTLLEAFAPVAPERVLGVRRDAEGLWLRLDPVVKGIRVTALVAGGRVVRREYGMGPARWTEELVSPRELRVHAPGMELAVRDMEARAAESLPDALFRLELPVDVRPFKPRER